MVAAARCLVVPKRGIVDTTAIPEIDTMARRRGARSDMYRAARPMGDIDAAKHGPTAYGKRVVRRQACAKTNSLTR